MDNLLLISKRNKKTMALIMTFVIVLSCFILVPETVAAADEKGAPSVEVLGATLRLYKASDNSKTGQSMRIGIRINNASKAKSCAITLEVKGKKYTVSTEEEGASLSNDVKVDKQFNNIHSKDTQNDSVVYAVVLNGIPKDFYGEDIGITGWVKNMNSEVQPYVSTTKSVNGVVAALNKRYPVLGIHMNDEGILCKAGGNKLTAGDLSDYNSNDMVCELDLKNVKLDKATNTTINADGSIEFGTDAGGYIYIPLPREISIGESIVVDISGSVLDGFNGFRCWPSNTETDAKDRRMSDQYRYEETNNGDFNISQKFTIKDADNVGVDKATAFCIKGPKSGNATHNLKITSISVTYSDTEQQYKYVNDFSTDPVDLTWGGDNIGRWNNDEQNYSITGNGNFTRWLQLPDTYNGKLTVSWKMKINKTNTRAFIQLDDPSGKDIAQIEFRGGTNGNTHIIADANGNITDITKDNYDADIWYEAKVTIDMDAKTYIIQIDNNSPVEFSGFKDNGAAAELGRITFGIRGDVEMKIDNICIY